MTFACCRHFMVLFVVLQIGVWECLMYEYDFLFLFWFPIVFRTTNYCHIELWKELDKCLVCKLVKLVYEIMENIPAVCPSGSFCWHRPPVAAIFIRDVFVFIIFDSIWFCACVRWYCSWFILFIFWSEKRQIQQISNEKWKEKCRE